MKKKEREPQVLKCVICETKINTGRLCRNCASAVDERKTEILTEEHPLLILIENRNRTNV